MISKKSLTVQMDSQIIPSLKSALNSAKPGIQAQIQMVPKPRPGTRQVFEMEGTCSKAGVLLLLYPNNNELVIVLTRRTHRLVTHQGQISLPGGRQEKGETFRQTAIRETGEELGISADAIEILGELTPLYLPVSNFCIHPLVAFAPTKPHITPSPFEVEEVIEIPLNHLLDDSNIQHEIRTIREYEVSIPFYQFQQYKIWGATAMVLSEFIDILKGI
jgi:8-oxo-dGTP pyrophosphatase MutT (NUDIX family)